MISFEKKRNNRDIVLYVYILLRLQYKYFRQNNFIIVYINIKMEFKCHLENYCVRYRPKFAPNFLLKNHISVTNFMKFCNKGFNSYIHIRYLKLLALNNIYIDLKYGNSIDLEFSVNVP